MANELPKVNESFTLPPGAVRLVSIKPIHPPIRLFKETTEGVEPVLQQFYVQRYEYLFEILPQPDVIVESNHAKD